MNEGITKRLLLLDIGKWGRGGGGKGWRGRGRPRKGERTR